MGGRVILTVYIGLAGRSPPGERSGGGAVRLLVVVEEASQAGGRVAVGRRRQHLALRQREAFHFP